MTSNSQRNHSAEDRINTSSLFIFWILTFRYGTVYKGKWAGETVAVKRYNKFHSSNDTEAQNSFNFRNKYIIGFKGLCCSLNSLVMEYCQYGSVQSWFGKGKLTEELKILICYDCARGVQVYILFHAHCCTNLLLSFELIFISCSFSSFIQTSSLIVTWNQTICSLLHFLQTKKMWEQNYQILGCQKIHWKLSCRVR